MNTNQNNRTTLLLTTLLLIGTGTGLMYFLDPDSGARRRLWLREKWARPTKKEQTSLAGAEATSGRVAGAGADDTARAGDTERAGVGGGGKTQSLHVSARYPGWKEVEDRIEVRTAAGNA